MRILFAFNHSIVSIWRKFKDYYLFIVFIACVVFTLMVVVQTSGLIHTISDKKFGHMDARILRIIAVGMGDSEKMDLTMEDVDLLKTQKGNNEGNQTDIIGLYGLVQRPGVFITEGINADCIVKGVSPEFIDFSEDGLLAGGKFFESNDVNMHSNVCVVNENFIKKYLKKLDVVGNSISIKLANENVENFQIIGILKNEKFGTGDYFKKDYFSEIYIPVSVAGRFFGSQKLDYIDTKIKDGSILETLSEKLSTNLELKHGEGSAFVVKKGIDDVETYNQVTNSTTVLAVTTGILSIIIGFFGIQNFMNLNIKLRAREISKRKVMGALVYDIYLQIQIETMIITVLGGFVGIVLGIIFGKALYFLFGVEDLINQEAILLTVLATIILGVTSGYIPAKQSASFEILPNRRQE